MNSNGVKARGPGVRALVGVASLMMAVGTQAQYVITQPEAIVINDVTTTAPAKATPYQTSVSVTNFNLLDKLEKVTLTLNKVNHTYANDVSILLVGPGGAVALMSKAGDGLPLSDATITFDQTKSALPQFSAITSGAYKPGDYGVASVVFLEPAPPRPYADIGLDVFTSKSPNGTWSIYVQDQQTLNDGSISSWQLNFYTFPVATLETNKLYVLENGSASTTITLDDSSTPVANLKVTGTSSNTKLLANSGIVISGSGATKTVKVTPVKNKYGPVKVTLKVADETSSINVPLDVEIVFVNQPPTITQVSANAVYTVQSVVTTNQVEVEIADIDTEDANLVLSATSSDPSIVANSPAGVFFSGTGSKRLMTVVPNGAATGVAKLTLLVSDGTLTNASSATITVNVDKTLQPMFGNPAAMAFDPGAVTNSAIPVYNLSGNIGRASVALNALLNIVPADMNLVLVPPHASPVTLLSRTGPSAAVDYAQLYFTEDGGTTLPTSDSIASVTYKAAGLTNLAGTDPNGSWYLYATNTGSGTGCTLAGGWVLNLWLQPAISTIPDVYGKEDTMVAVEFTVGSMNGSVTNVSGAIPSNTGLATIKTTLTGNNVRMEMTGKANAFGTNEVVVTAKDNKGFQSQARFLLGLWAENDAPTISFIEKQVTRAGVPTAPVTFTINDPETPGALTLSTYSDNPVLVPSANVVLEPTATPTTWTVTLFPLGNYTGTANISITVSDGLLTSTTTFLMYVQEAGNPLFLVKSPITINANAAATPYPSSNWVSGLLGKVAQVQATLFDTTYPVSSHLSVLLVGPKGQSVLLMGKAGGTAGMTSTTLIFGADTEQEIPAGGPILSGIYRPTRVGDAVTLPGPAPAPPYGNSMSVFEGTDPNGAWYLYVYSDTSGKGGIVKSGWQLSIQTTPKIADIPDVYTTENTPVRVNITVGDAQPGVPITVTAVPRDPDLIQQPIAVSGSGSSRTLTINPVPYRFGTNWIDVTAEDNLKNFSSASFRIGVERRNLPPIVSTIANQTTTVATEIGPIYFTVWDPQSQEGIKVDVTSSDPALLAKVDVRKYTNTPDTNTWGITLLPAGVLTGNTRITLVVTDSVGLKTSTAFDLSVVWSPVFSGPAVEIPEGWPLEYAGVPYPSTVRVKGLGGFVTSVRVSLDGFTHPYPEDVSVLLVSPDDKKSVMLMSHAGGEHSAYNLRLSFASSGDLSPIPDSGQLQSMTYRPGAYAPPVVIPAPAPEGPYSTSLSDFYGTMPNGDWKLYVIDDTFPDAGAIYGGWFLYLETGPVIDPIAAQTTKENMALIVPFVVSDAMSDVTKLETTASVSDNSPPDLVTNLVITGTSASRSLKITPTANLPSAAFITNAPGTCKITLTVRDPARNIGSSLTFPLTVQYVNQAPIALTSTNWFRVDENAAITIPYTIGDVDSWLWVSNIVVISSNPELVPNGTNIIISGVSSDPGKTSIVNVKVVPAMFKNGSTVLSFIASDGQLTATNQLTLAVVPQWQPPVISAISNQVLVAGSTCSPLGFTVGSVEVAPSSLVCSAISSRQDLIADRNIVFGGTDANRTIQYTSTGRGTGEVRITVTISDGNASTSTDFLVEVTEAPPTFFANTETIRITGKTTASVYPSFIEVSGMEGLVHSVQVRLDGFNHTVPIDADVLLVSPDGKAVMLMSGAGGKSPVSNLRVQFDDLGVVLGRDQMASATYQPANYTGGLLPSPAPTNILSQLSAFAGINPNGTWKLFVNNRGTSTGQITGGWALVITPAPTLVVDALSPPSMTINEGGTASIYFTIGDMTTSVTNLTVTAATDNPVLLPSRAVTFAGHPPGSGGMIATLRPEPNQSGTVYVTLKVVRGDGATAQVRQPLSVIAVNSQPTFSRIGTQYIDQNGKGSVEFLVADADTPLNTMTLVALSDNSVLLPNSNVFFEGTTTNVLRGLPANSVPGTSRVRLWMQPTGYQAGSANITLYVTDPGPGGTNIVTKTFEVVVNEVVWPPFFTQAPAPEHMVGSGAWTYPIRFGVASRNIPTPNLVVTGKSADQTLVKDANIIVEPVEGVNVTNRTVTIKAEAGVTGTEAKPVIITLIVTDPHGPVSAYATFKLWIGPNPERVYANPVQINILDASPASPYPSGIKVNNLVGNVAHVKVTLKDFQHTFPSDVAVLLVGPGGTKSILMNRAGDGGHGMPPMTLTFEQDPTLPQVPSTPLSSGTYKPFDYKGGNYSLPSPAPAGPYTANLDNFLDKPASGDWALYVVDDTPGDAGVISNGWTLTITTKPVILGLQPLTTMENTVVRQSFTVADDSTWSTLYQATADVLEDSGPVNDAGVKLEGSGTNWTVVVTPTANAWGTNTIRVAVANANGQYAIASFPMTVTYANTAPSFAPIPDMTVTAGEVAVVPLNYSDAHTPQDQLVMTFASSDTALVPLANMKLVGTNLWIAPSDLLTGKSEIAVSIKNKDGLTTTQKFMLYVVESLWPKFANEASITLPDNAPASPYPSTIEVQDVAGTIVKVRVTISGLQHNFPSDVSLLLVSPSGGKVVLMSRCGGGVPLTDPSMRITFDDDASARLPQYSALTFGTYQPTDYKISDEFFAPAPPGLYSKQLSAFIGSSPNGPWKLYAQDDASPDSGLISGGWILEFITTAPGISSIGPQTVAENGSITLPFIVSSQITPANQIVVTATSSGDVPGGLLPQGSLVLAGTGSSRTLTITPAANMPSAVSSGNGNSTVTLRAADGSLVSTRSFPVTITWINQAPVISGLADSSTPANKTLDLPFQVADADNAIESLAVSATNEQSALGVVSLTGTGSSRTLSFVPSGPLGDATVTVRAFDGSKSTLKTIKVTVLPASSSVGVPGESPIIAIVKTADGIQIKVTGSADSEYLIQSTTDLKAWTKIGSVTTDSSGVGTYTAPRNTGSGTILFRALAR